jgi:hypothetical protein
MFRKTLTAIAVVLGLSASACTSGRDSARLERLQNSPEPKVKIFGGIVSSPDPEAQTPKRRFVFHTHGMGETDGDKDLVAPMTAALELAGFQPVLDPRRCRLVSGSCEPWNNAPTAFVYDIRGEGLSCRTKPNSKPCRFSTFGQFRSDLYRRAEDGHEIIVYTYFWHADLWSIQEPFLKYDEAGLKTSFDGSTSGKWSAALKTSVLNYGLSDVAAYLGAAGEPLREGMSAAICAMLREAASGVPTEPAKVDTSFARYPSSCLSTEAARGLAGSDARISFITHSLGSRMLFDVLEWEPATTDPQAGEVAGPREGLIATRQVTDSFFMAANQLPLLAIGRISATKHKPENARTSEPASSSVTQSCSEGLPAFLTVSCEAQSVIPFRNLDVVGFFDPGDLLGYSLVGGRSDEQQPADIRFISILHRNTWQIAWKGSLPHLAHDQELALDSRKRFRNPNAVALILCGGTANARGELKAGDCLKR